jgi:hypothetical protein
MPPSRWHRGFIFAALVVSAPLALGGLTGCGADKPTPKLADVKPGSMPEGADWSAEYYSEDLGTIELIVKGNDAKGKWQRPHKDKWAEFYGTVDGNLLKFSWHEYLIGGIGPNTETEGKGYFVYTRPGDQNADDVLEGQIGRHEDEVGDAFKAIKQRNVVPDLDKIGGTAGSDITGGDWDQNEESGTPEKPAHPN